MRRVAHKCREGELINSIFNRYFLVFVETPLSIRLFLSALVIVVYLFCFYISICNDRLRGTVGQLFWTQKLSKRPIISIREVSPQIKSLESTVYSVQPLFESATTKISFSNLLTMNSQHQTAISLTFFGIKYNSHAILEVCTFNELFCLTKIFIMFSFQFSFHSITIVLLLYQANNLR